MLLSAGLTVEYSAESLAMAEAGARAVGRDPAALRRAAFLYTAVDANRAAAVERLRPKIAFMMRNDFVAPSVAGSGIAIDRDAVKQAIARRDMKTAAKLIPDEAVEAFAVCGSPEDCKRRIAEYRAVGIDEIVLLIVGDTDAEAAALDLIRALSR